MDKNKHDRATWGLHKEEQKSGSGWKNGDGVSAETRCPSISGAASWRRLRSGTLKAKWSDSRHSLQISGMPTTSTPHRMTPRGVD